MSLVLGVAESLPFEDMSQVATAVVAYNLRPHHSQAGVFALAHGVGNGIPECRPSASRIKLMVRFVERRVAAGAGIHARGRVVLVVFARAGHFSAFVAEDSELLCINSSVTTFSTPCAKLGLWERTLWVTYQDSTASAILPPSSAQGTLYCLPLFLYWNRRERLGRECWASIEAEWHAAGCG
jgi:hypothetical protein